MKHDETFRLRKKKLKVRQDEEDEETKLMAARSQNSDKSFFPLAGPSICGWIA